MTSTTNNVSGETVDGMRLDVQAFASLWSALRTNYEGTNITKTIARLLNMYQPDDGIQTYERLLKTLCVLLEDFDENGFRLLASMVPPPKGSSDEDIKNIFLSATGFTRLNAPIFQQSDLLESTQILSQDAHQYRGFLPPDIDPSNQQKVQRSNYRLQGNPQMYSHPHFADRQPDTLNMQQNYKMNRLQAPYLMQNSSYGDYIVKTVDNKFYRVPAVSMNTSGMYYRPYQMISHQERQGILSEKNHTATSGSLEKNPTPLIPEITGNNKIDEIKRKINKSPEMEIKENKNDKIDDKKSPEISINNLNNLNNQKKLELNNFKVSKNLADCIDRFLERAKHGQELLPVDKIKNSPEIKKIKNPVNNQQMFLMQPSVNDVATYKKQYYDALMSLQQAKAVKDCNAYRSEYFQVQQQQQQQQHWIYQQQRMAMGSQYAAQRLIPPEFSYRANEWMASYSGVRHHDPALNPDPCLVYPRQDFPRNIYRNQSNEKSVNAKRHKLEEIATKLKEQDFTKTKKK